MEDRQSYRDIFKATSVMGGVEVVRIAVRIVGAKVISIILGPLGMGVNALFQSTIDLVNSATGLGLNTSGVRELSQAKEESKKAARTAASLRTWVWITGLLGALVMLVAAPLLSRWTFDTTEYAWGFRWLAIAMFFKALAGGENAVMRGMMRLRLMANAAAVGSIIGLAVSIPLYYFLRTDGIIWALIATAVVTFIVERSFSSRIKFEKSGITPRERLADGLPMVKLGAVLMLGGFISYLALYLTRISISHIGGIPEVGIYQAGMSISNQYVGMIFTAMVADYFPRLSAAAGDNRKMSGMVNKQAEVALLIIAPMAIAIIAAAPLLIRLLYTADFLSITGYLQWIAVGMLFKSWSWAMAFTILAKGESTLYLVTEFVAHTIIFGLTVGGYIWKGLTGAGIAFLASYIIYSLIIFIIISRRYGYRPDGEYLKMFGLLLTGVAASLAVTLILGPSLATYIINGVLFTGVGFYSLWQFNRRMGLFRKR